MKEERQALLKDLAKLKAALQQLALRHQGKQSKQCRCRLSAWGVVSLCQVVSATGNLAKLEAALQLALRHEGKQSKEQCRVATLCLVDQRGFICLAAVDALTAAGKTAVASRNSNAILIS